MLAFTAAPDYETPDDADADNVYEVTVQVSDGTDSDMADLLVTVQNVTELTALTGPASVAFPENSWSRVATFTASSEEDRADIVWTLGGADSGHFSIDNPPGALRFALQAVAPRIFSAPPDFEAPVDGRRGQHLRADRIGRSRLVRHGHAVLHGHRHRCGRGRRRVVAVCDPSRAGHRADRRPHRPGRRDRRHGGLAVGAVHGPQLAWAVIDGAATASYTPVAADTNTFLAGDGDLRGRARDRQDGQRGGAQCGHGAPVDGSDGGDR